MIGQFADGTQRVNGWRQINDAGRIRLLGSDGIGAGEYGQRKTGRNHDSFTEFFPNEIEGIMPTHSAIYAKLCTTCASLFLRDFSYGRRYDFFLRTDRRSPTPLDTPRFAPVGRP